MSGKFAISPRNRPKMLGLALLVVGLGGLFRIYDSALPFLVGAYAPDTLWAMLVFLCVLCARPAVSNPRATFIALSLSFGVEAGQLLQWPWLVAIRDTRIGGSLLGHGFLWSDLGCYSLGIALAALIDARFQG